MKDSFEEFVNILKRLRAPDGCPWDREQTPATLQSSLIEEAYEVIESIESGDIAHIREELGDMFLVLTMISYMYEQEESTSIKDILQDVSAKLIRRHPHVFGDACAADSDTVLKQWDVIKTQVEGRPEKKYILDTVSRKMPPLERCYKIQKKAAKTGFDWPDIESVIDKMHEELDELKQELLKSERNNTAIQEECGDILFTAVNITRYMNSDPSIILNQANNKFCKRFNFVEEKMKENNIEMNSATAQQMDHFWNKSKLEK